MKQTAPNNKKKRKGSYSVSVRMSNYRRPVVSVSFSKADAKVADLGIRTKYTKLFLSEISKLFHK